MNRRIAVLSALLSLALVTSADAATPVPAPLPTCNPTSFSAANLAAVGNSPGTYSYSVGEQTLTFAQPPEGFQPDNASNATLQRYGFPPKPSEPGALQQWKAIFGSGYKPAPPIGCSGPVPPMPSPPGPVFHGKISGNANWSGFEDAAQGNPSQWQAVAGDYIQTNGSARSSCKSNAIVSSWTGLGGDWGDALLQSGTDAYTSGYIDAWAEWISKSGVADGGYMAVTVHPGDLVEQSTWYHASGQYVYFYTKDVTTGEGYLALVEGLGTNYNNNGASADFIDERPSGETGYYPLLNFGSINWSEAIVLNAAGTWAELGTPNHIRDIMYGHSDGSGNLLAEPSLLTSGKTFTDHYHACQ